MVKIKDFHSLEEVCVGGEGEGGGGRGPLYLGHSKSKAASLANLTLFLVLPGKLVINRLKLGILFCALL